MRHQLLRAELRTTVLLLHQQLQGCEYRSVRHAELYPMVQLFPLQTPDSLENHPKGPDHNPITSQWDPTAHRIRLGSCDLHYIGSIASQE